MPLYDYNVNRDLFEKRPHNTISFPCCCCVHQDKSQFSHPCNVCDHNLSAQPDVDRSHEECVDCSLEQSDPPKCNGHAAGPVACGSFVSKG